MRTFTLLTTLVAGSLAKHVLHEKRDALPIGWEKGERLEKHVLMPMEIALTQQNLHQLDAHLIEVSDPASTKYGQHWTSKQVVDYYAPSDETRNAVIDWLVKGGIEKERLADSLYRRLGWITVDVTVAEAEHLMQTKYYKYHHTSGKTRYGTDEYHVPAEIHDHVDFITPTLHLDARNLVAPEKRDLEERAVGSLGAPGSGNGPKTGPTANPLAPLANTNNCDSFISPDCLRALYKIPAANSNVQQNPFGIVQYTPQAYLQSDLNSFFGYFSPKQAQKTPTLVSIDGGTPQTSKQGSQYNAESDLDFEYGMSLVNPISVTLYQTGDEVEGGSFNTFLDAVDGSYCTYNGGDDPRVDPKYPDPSAGGYKGPENCGSAPLTKVISESYTGDEAGYPVSYVQRQCNEYAKIGLMGTSLLFASGDFGVAGNSGKCIDPVTGQPNSTASGRFNPSFPSVCPYVTSVGATQIPAGGSVTTPEKACETVIYSGGGFSNVFPLPSYQSAAVTSYLKNHPPPYTSAQYNNSGKVRAYPDVSANGAKYFTVISGKNLLEFGTSASAPTFASIITIVNERRAQLGKKSLGFLNPLLYSNTSIFNDITKGSNQGCGTRGFDTAAGWDPVTGLGTPDTEKLLAYATNLA